MCVQLKLTTKCTNLKLKQMYEFSLSLFLRVGVELVTLSGFCFVFNFLQLIIFMYVLFSFFAVCRRAYASFYSLFQSTHILLNY